MHRFSLDVANSGLTYEGITNQKLRDLIEGNRFNEFFDAIQTHGLNFYQHELMATRYLGSIAQVLKNYSNSELDDSLYIDLSWEGLHRTREWNETLDRNEQERIEQEWAKYKIIGNKNCK